LKKKNSSGGKGKGTKKYGRMGRKPAHQRYNAEKHWETNKARRLAKAAKRNEKLASRKAAKTAARNLTSA
jgi:hypothetical protein